MTELRKWHLVNPAGYMAGCVGFIAANKAEIDAAIENVTSNKKPAHYLAYGPRC